MFVRMGALFALFVIVSVAFVVMSHKAIAEEKSLAMAGVEFSNALQDLQKAAKGDQAYLKSISKGILVEQRRPAVYATKKVRVLVKPATKDAPAVWGYKEVKAQLPATIKVEINLVEARGVVARSLEYADQKLAGKKESYDPSTKAFQCLQDGRECLELDWWGSGSVAAIACGTAFLVCMANQVIPLVGK